MRSMEANTEKNLLNLIIKILFFESVKVNDSILKHIVQSPCHSWSKIINLLVKTETISTRKTNVYTP